MAEKFNSYVTSIPFSNNLKGMVIVPQQGVSINSEYGYGSRPSGSTSQVHSIYLTYSSPDSIMENPESMAPIVSISILDNSNGREYYIAKAVMILPNSSFYIEKSITLTTNESLKLTYHGRKD